MAKAGSWPTTDTQPRKRGEQTGLDTACVPSDGDIRVRIRLYR